MPAVLIVLGRLEVADLHSVTAVLLYENALDIMTK